MLWLCACARYWLGRGLVYERHFLLSLNLLFRFKSEVNTSPSNYYHVFIVYSASFLRSSAHSPIGLIDLHSWRTMIPVFFAIGRSKDILSSSAGSWTQKSDMTCWHNTKVELYKFKTNTAMEKIKIPAIKNVRKKVPTSRISMWSLYQFSYYSGTSMCDHLW